MTDHLTPSVAVTEDPAPVLDARAEPDADGPGTALGSVPDLVADDPETAQAPLADDASPKAHPEAVTRDLLAYPALVDVLTIGDAGRQPEIVPVTGPLSVGVADTLIDFFTCTPFEVRACSTRGASHRHSGAPRQDSFCLAHDERHVVLCVTDGVSQGEHSAVAAETAARAAAKLLLDAPDGDLAELDWTQLANRVSRRILDEARYRRLVELPDDLDAAEQLRTVRRAMATTAVVAAVARVPDADGRFEATVAVLAGDSGAFALRAGAFEPFVGGKEAHADGITDSSVHPLPGPANPVVSTGWLERGDALVLMTDGLGDPLGDGQGDVGTTLAERWRTPPSAASFFTDLAFYRKSFDDDRTAVGVWILPPTDKEA